MTKQIRPFSMGPLPPLLAIALIVYAAIAYRDRILPAASPRLGAVLTVPLIGLAVILARALIREYQRRLATSKVLAPTASLSPLARKHPLRFLFLMTFFTFGVMIAVQLVWDAIDGGQTRSEVGLGYLAVSALYACLILYLDRRDLPSASPDQLHN